MNPPAADTWSPLGRTLVWEQAMARGAPGPGPSPEPIAIGPGRAAAAPRPLPAGAGAGPPPPPGPQPAPDPPPPAGLTARPRGLLPLLGELSAAAGLGAGPPADVESPAAGQALWELSRMVARSGDLP